MAERKKIKILFVSNGTKVSPATRYRIYQWLPFLDKEGIEYKVYSIISESMTCRMIKSSTLNSFLRNLYYLHVFIERTSRSLKVIFLARGFDVVFLQRAVFSLGLEKLLKMVNKNIIFDIDDSIYMPDKEEKGIVGRIKKYIKKEEVVSILKLSKCAIVENNHIKNFVQNYCKNVYIITGPMDIEKNFPREYRSGSEDIAIGWIGSPSTSAYLGMLDEVFQKLSQKYKIKVRLIGAGNYSIDGVFVENIAWNEETEVSELHKFDIGVMPMPDNEWTRGKVGCKMLQYMANAIPAVVSWTPTNADIIEDGVNGFLAVSEDEWIEKLSRLIEDFQLRQKMGASGRKTVEEKFSVIANAPKCLRIIKNIQAEL
jgi:glycosyltransferase involved in cell wall biosynthesis